MANVDIGPYLAEIGEIAVHHLQREPDGILIFAEAQPGVVSCSIFHDEGDLVRYRDCSKELFEKIREIWKMEDEPLRWTTMSYRIDGGRFDVEFGFDPPPPPGEMGRPRREALLRRFGEKPVDDSEPD